MCCLCHRPICVCIHNYGLVCTQTLLPVRGWIRGLILLRSFLRAGMLPSLLMRERTQHQPTSIRVLLMAGTFENWSSTWPKCVEGLKTKFKYHGIPARDFRARLFPKPLPHTARRVWGPDYIWGRAACCPRDTTKIIDWWTDWCISSSPFCSLSPWQEVIQLTTELVDLAPQVSCHIILMHTFSVYTVN